MNVPHCCVNASSQYHLSHRMSASSETEHHDKLATMPCFYLNICLDLYTSVSSYRSLLLSPLLATFPLLLQI